MDYFKAAKRTATAAIFLFSVFLSLPAQAQIADSSTSTDEANATTTATTTATIPSGFVTFSFDDGWTSQYANAKPILEAAGMKGTFYIISDEPGRPYNDIYMSADQVLDLEADGHEIGAHTKTHPDLTTLSNQQALSEIKGSREDLLKIGVKSVNSLAYPYGTYNDSIANLVKNNGYGSARTVDGGLNDGSTDKYRLYSESVEAGTPFATITSFIDAAAADNKWLVLLFHDIVNDVTNLPYGTTPANLQAIVDYVKQKNMVVDTISGMMDHFHPKGALSVVVKVEGGTANPNAFQVRVAGKSPTPASFKGNASGTSVRLEAGTYKVAIASGPQGYSTASSSECSGSIAANESKSCTFTLSKVDDGRPVITLNGSSSLAIMIGDQYADEGATAADDIDGNITSRIVASGTDFSTAATGTHIITYNVSDNAGNKADEVTRTVTVRSATATSTDTGKPVITLKGNATTSVKVGDAYDDAGATAMDDIDGDISSRIVVTGNDFSTASSGIHRINFDVEDNAGNKAVTVYRDVTVLSASSTATSSDRVKPVILLLGSSTVNVKAGELYTDAGVTALDDVDGDITSKVVVTGNFPNNASSGVYRINYNVKDNAGNAADQVYRIVNIDSSTTTATTTPGNGNGGNGNGNGNGGNGNGNNGNHGGGGGVIYVPMPTKEDDGDDNDNKVEEDGDEDDDDDDDDEANVPLVDHLYGLNPSLVEAVTLSEAKSIYGLKYPLVIRSKNIGLYNRVVKGHTNDISEGMNKAILQFIQNGTKTTKRLGEGERAGVVSSFASTFGHLPDSLTDWQDIVKIANGRWPSLRNAQTETNMKNRQFKSIYNYDGKKIGKNDDAAISIMAYGLRPVKRNMASEKRSMQTFLSVFKRNPESATDWNVVRAVAYSGAKRR